MVYYIIQHNIIKHIIHYIIKDIVFCGRAQATPQFIDSQFPLFLSFTFVVFDVHILRVASF